MSTFLASILATVFNSFTSRKFCYGLGFFTSTTPSMCKSFINLQSSPTVRTMESHMVCLRSKQLKIFWTAIQFVPVFMVNNFCAIKRSSQYLLHNVAMFFHVLAVNANAFIPKPIYPIFDSTAFMKGITSSTKTSIMLFAKSFCCMYFIAIRHCTCSHDNDCIIHDTELSTRSV